MTKAPDAATRAYTGRKRERKTRFSIKVADRVSQIVITIGGLGTIVAVLGVFLYLAAVTFPLFESAEAAPVDLETTPWNGIVPRHFEVDEFQSIGWALADTGALAVFRADSGALLDTKSIVEEGTITSAYFALEEDTAVLGFDDGSIRLGRIGFGTRFFEPEDVPSPIRSLRRGDSAPFEGGMVQRTPQAQFRVQEVQHAFEDPISTGNSPVTLLAYTNGTGSPRLAYCTQDGRLKLANLEQKRNFLTGETARVLGKTYDIPFENVAGDQPTQLALSARGDAIYLAWADGRAQRFDARSLDKIAMVEQVDLVADPNAELTTLEMLLGGTTLIAGDSEGRLAAWFPARTGDAGTGDGFKLYEAHVLPQASAAVTALSMSARTRTFAAGFADGRVGVFHVTSEQQILDVAVTPAESVSSVFLAPKENGLYAGTSASLMRWKFDPRHPEASLSSLFSKVWYEGYTGPSHKWQSSGASEDLEPKLGLVPLVFGSIKATFYSMLFGAPLALLAAIYTSEFLNPKTKAKVKPTIEVMASLPSVVLGFLAGLVIAPFVEQVVPAVLCLFFTVPFTILLGSYFWQLLPHHIGLRLAHRRIWFIVMVVPFGIAWAWLLGPIVESLVFSGDIKSWLDGQIGTGFGGWLIVTLPMSALIVAFASARGLNRWIRNACSGWTRAQFAAVDFVKFLGLTAVTLATAAAFAALLTIVGLDPRGTYVDTYEQRNSLVVGFVMGFAIIPIIYTIAEDALSSVPDHLRSASLGSGATPWQTAITIVVPTAMSGLFSAMMVGLGRAVGETMIVLMAAGNTPVTDWNIFNGFRTLSANIAVELPEAVQQSTHYRTLFLAALTLFILTFLVNTVAELVRIRFRKRVVQI